MIKLIRRFFGIKKQVSVFDRTLSDAQIERATLYYKANKRLIDKQISDVVAAKVIGGIRNTPVRWLPENWKWFLGTYL